MALRDALETATVPPSIACTPGNTFTSVVLPEPLGPITLVSLPRTNAKSSPLIACTPPKLFLRFFISKICIGLFKRNERAITDGFNFERAAFYLVLSVKTQVGYKRTLYAHAKQGITNLRTCFSATLHRLCDYIYGIIRVYCRWPLRIRGVPRTICRTEGLLTRRSDRIRIYHAVERSTKTRKYAFILDIRRRKYGYFYT